MGQEKRGRPRATTKIEITFKEVGGFVKAYMLNVSNGGLFVKAEDPLPLDSPVLLKLTLPGESEEMQIGGCVVWNNPKDRKNSFPKGMGIQFVEIKPEHAKKIEGFVKKYQKEIKARSFL